MITSESYGVSDDVVKDPVDNSLSNSDVKVHLAKDHATGTQPSEGPGMSSTSLMGWLDYFGFRFRDQSEYSNRSDPPSAIPLNTPSVVGEKGAEVFAEEHRWFQSLEACRVGFLFPGSRRWYTVLRLWNRQAR